MKAQSREKIREGASRQSEKNTKPYLAFLFLVHFIPRLVLFQLELILESGKTDEKKQEKEKKERGRTLFSLI
jgi:hypothetical protein